MEYIDELVTKTKNNKNLLKSITDSLSKIQNNGLRKKTLVRLLRFDELVEENVSN